MTATTTQAPWRALPDDIPLMAALRWLHINCIPIEFGRRGDAVTLYAPLTDDELHTLLREVGR